MESLKYSIPSIICSIILTLAKPSPLDEINVNLYIKDVVNSDSGIKMSDYEDATQCQIGNGESYDGTVSNTKSGYECQKWPSQATVHNYCRNPDNEKGVWCYIKNIPGWEFCDVPVCGKQSGGYPGQSVKMTMEAMQSTAVRAIANGNMAFGQRLYESMRKEEEGRNLVMSPYSVSSVMAMASLGARGDTLREMRAGMEFPSNQQLVAGYSNVLKVLNENENFTLETANHLFVHKEKGFHFDKNFEKVLKESFYAKATPTNFGASERARKLINDWVEKKTKKIIKDLIPPGVLSQFTRVVLVNAIYFKGDWASKFNKQYTLDDNFYVEENKVVKTKMMNKNGFEFKMINIQKLNAKAIELPYKGNRVSMYIFLPNDKFGLADVETKLFKIKIHKLFSKIDVSQETIVNLRLPKFTLEKTINLQSNLMQLGIIQMFDENRANFSGMSSSDDLYVSAIMQKAFIKVDEEGSEATAATFMNMNSNSNDNADPLPQFFCDHPFIFFIKHKLTDMVLFSGRLINPT